MFGNTRPGAQAYGQMGVDSDALVASPHQLIVMLFDGALRAIDTATVQMNDKDIEGKGRSIGKAIAIVGSGLSASLDLHRGGEIAGNLHALYDYIVRRLTEANIANDGDKLDEARRLLAQMRENWIAIGHASHHPGANA
jgi:flagellar protein FliS